MFNFLKRLFENRTFGAARSSLWPKLRAEFLKKNPICAVCRTDKELEVHHETPVHINPLLELEEKNLITLCENNHCHLIFGHLGNFKSYNKNVEADAALFREKIKNRP